MKTELLPIVAELGEARPGDHAGGIPMLRRYHG
jgi:hypothetical protein